MNKKSNINKKAHDGANISEHEHPQDDSGVELRSAQRNGYTHARFILNPNYDYGKDAGKCESLNGTEYEIGQLLSLTNYDAPLFETSHVGCQCSFEVFNPDDGNLTPYLIGFGGRWAKLDNKKINKKGDTMKKLSEREGYLPGRVNSQGLESVDTKRMELANEFTKILKESPDSILTQRFEGFKDLPLEEAQVQLYKAFNHPTIKKHLTNEEIDRELRDIPLTRKYFKFVGLLEQLQKNPKAYSYMEKEIGKDKVKEIAKLYREILDISNQALTGYQSKQLSETDKDFASQYIKERLDEVYPIVERFATPQLEAGKEYEVEQSPLEIEHQNKTSNFKRLKIKKAELSEDEQDRLKKHLNTYNSSELNNLLNTFIDISNRLDKFIMYNKKIYTEKNINFDESKIRLYSLKGDLRKLIDYIKKYIVIEDYYTIKDLLGIIGIIIGSIEDILLEKKPEEQFKQEESYNVSDDWIKKFKRKKSEQMTKDIQMLYRVYKELLTMKNNKALENKPVKEIYTDELKNSLAEISTNVETVELNLDDAFKYIKSLLNAEIQILEKKYPDVKLEGITSMATLSLRENILNKK